MANEEGEAGPESPINLGLSCGCASEARLGEGAGLVSAGKQRFLGVIIPRPPRVTHSRIVSEDSVVLLESAV